MTKSGIAMIFAFASAMTVTGCSSKPTTADLMRGHASEAQAQVDLKNQLAKDWERGTSLVSSGERKVSDGEKRVRAAERDLERAKRQITQGNKEIADGKKLVTESETRFKQAFPEYTGTQGH